MAKDTTNTEDQQPPVSRSEATRRKILQAARQLFTERGYDGTGIRDIESAAGVKRGVVTYHFGNKEDVWKAMFSSLFLPYLEEQRQMIPLLQSIDPATRARLAIENFVRRSAANPHMNQLMIQENFTHTWRSDWIHEHFLKPIRDLNQQIADGHPLMERCHSDPHFYYILLGACATVFSHRCEVEQLFDEDVADQAFIDRHVAAVMQVIDAMIELSDSRA